MAQPVEKILKNDNLSREEIIILLESSGEARRALFRKAAEVKQKYVGNKVFFRGLIEFSNICSKNCYYCGIRKGNKNIERYNLADEEIFSSARFAYENGWGSVVLQSGEVESDSNTARISRILRGIKELSSDKLGITISLGEQSGEVYQDWFGAGAHRYLLRIESSAKDIYSKIHPNDRLHDFDRRLECLKSLQRTGYQTGTGVMIGLPFQTTGHLADDILFMKEVDIDMCGMGPYIEHAGTPLIKHKEQLLPAEIRFDLTLKMIAVIRIIMKDINIAAATALQAIDPVGREKAIMTGANIIMPNITPGKYRDSYSLYENKPCTDESADDCKGCLEARLNMADAEVGYNEWGDSRHYLRRTRRENYYNYTDN